MGIEGEKMKGIIDSINEKKTKDDKFFYIMEIDGMEYSCWDETLVSGLRGGDQVEFDFKESGKWKNISELRFLGKSNRPVNQISQSNSNFKSFYLSYGKDIAVALIQAGSGLVNSANKIEKLVIRLGLAFYDASEKPPDPDESITPKSPGNNDLPNANDDFEVYKYQLANTEWQTKAELEDWWNQRQKALLKIDEKQRKEIIKLYHDELKSIE